MKIRRKPGNSELTENKLIPFGKKIFKSPSCATEPQERESLDKINSKGQQNFIKQLQVVEMDLRLQNMTICFGCMVLLQSTDTSMAKQNAS